MATNAIRIRKPTRRLALCYSLAFRKYVQTCTTLLATVVLFGAIAACGGSDSSDPLVVATDKGTVRGVEQSGIQKFFGLPYAAAPLRWQAPKAAAAWTGTRDASQFGNHCPQFDSPFSRAARTSEDCLFLNVYRPAAPPAGPLPVMVWIHGGSLLNGDSDPYDPSQLVAEGVVVVTVNYRLGALGFLAHPALSAEANGSSGNYGLMDQQAALRWVQTNIAAFGGNPANVTLFGESAGGVSVHAHMTSPLAAGLFHKAIVQSGTYSLNTPTLEAAHSLGTTFANAAGCPNQTAACLRELKLATILAVQPILISGTSIQPNIDNLVQLRTHREAFATGKFNRVPVIEGSNAFEHSLVTAVFFDFNPPPLGLGPVTANNYADAQAVVLNFNDTRKTALQTNAVYPVAAFASPTKAIDTIGTDNGYACSALGALRALASHTSVYQYEFNDPNPPMLFFPPTSAHPSWGAYHASELQYLFRITPPFPLSPPPPTLDAAQKGLSANMIAMWANFARSGNPNASGSTLWPAFTTADETVLSLEPTGLRTSKSFAANHHCSFWLAP